MLFNSAKDRHLLFESLKRTGDVPFMISALSYVIENHSPFSLYVATRDRSDCLWIFDPKVVLYMLGGEVNYKAVFDSMFLTEEEKSVGVIMFVMKKTGPLISLRLEEELLLEVSRDLKDHLKE
jgi:hypothetical protein